MTMKPMAGFPEGILNTNHQALLQPAPSYDGAKLVQKWPEQSVRPFLKGEGIFHLGAVGKIFFEFCNRVTNGSRGDKLEKGGAENFSILGIKIGHFYAKF